MLTKLKDIILNGPYFKPKRKSNMVTIYCIVSFPKKPTKNSKPTIKYTCYEERQAKAELDYLSKSLSYNYEIKELEVDIPTPITIYSLIDEKGNVIDSATSIKTLKDNYVFNKNNTIVETEGWINK